MRPISPKYVAVLCATILNKSCFLPLDEFCLTMFGYCILAQKTTIKQIVCQGTNACYQATLSRTQLIQVSGQNALYGATIISGLSYYNNGDNNRTITIEINNTNTATPSSASAVDIYCNEDDNCNLFCYSPFRYVTNYIVVGR